jgi:3-dehydroquinate dehydratase-1
VRADLFGAPIGEVVGYIDKIKRAAPFPLIGTIRETDLNRADRAAWYARLARHVDIVDVELGMPGWSEAAGDIAGSAAVMVSEHDFEATPDFRGLGDIVARAARQGARIVKIAAMAKSAGDVTRLMRFTEDCEMPLVSIAMGDVGRISRVIAPLFGSLFTYGHLREPLAPGQPPVLEVVKALREYYPARR